MPPVGEEEAQPEVSPDETLANLYKSSRPAVELLPGVNLSPIVNSCCLPGDAKAMLEENWMPQPPEEGEETPEDAAPPPAFDPASIEYSEMQLRLSKSIQLIAWNEQTIKIKEIENEIDGTRDATVKEEKGAELEAEKAKMEEIEGQLAEIKGSFAEDPLSLVPWMQSLFQLADAGLTTFQVDGNNFPYTRLQKLFGNDNTTSLNEGPEKILGLFKKRYERERGPGKIQLLCKLAPNIYQDGYSPAVIEPLVDKIRESLYGAEPTEPLDFVQLFWWDFKDMDVMPTLKALQKLSEDKLEISEDGEVSIAEPKKIKGIGLVDFPPKAILSAIQSGVPIVSVQIPFSVADRSRGKVLTMCRQYEIKLLACDSTMGGLISEKYLGTPQLESTDVDLDLETVQSTIEKVNNYGGWAEIQSMLQKIKAIADKHGVKMQTVALRWLIDQGTFPVLGMQWRDRSWRQFGFNHWAGATPGMDWQLFQVESFLDIQDVETLNGLGK